MIRRLSLSCLFLVAAPAMAEHPHSVIQDDPHQTCTAGTAWDDEIAGCMPVVSG
ncbi:hypothetical protein [Jannaschia pohangensis]|uniref:Uncharacterized protein n=1 Tax=Jannaschia pohangensis TaxID=390807 RepID=A0A1I3S971_9RHOB|nr:hypothetical protein [Jannaschia pohangensis]SFJ54159.1 hypothetical protein SAMN04488095_3032 [Jannaschia pohangensis]